MAYVEGPLAFVGMRNRSAGMLNWLRGGHRAPT
jgi:hypothetical protein